MAYRHIRDAFIRGNADGSRWTVGTQAVEMTFAVSDGCLALLAFTQKLANDRREYLVSYAAVMPCAVIAEDMRSWVFLGAEAEKTEAGGQPVVQLTLPFAGPGVAFRFRIIAYPGTAVLRLWVELDNTGDVPISTVTQLLTLPIQDDQIVPFTHYWMVGGNSGADHGLLHSATVTDNYHQVVAAQATSAYMPWMALQRSGAPDDGWFMALEYLGNWRMMVTNDSSGMMLVSAEIPDLADVRIDPGEALVLPAITIGAFAGDLDDMGVVSYDWQYRYLWDYTNMDYYARPKWAVPWFYCARNLQEQFAERLAYLDMDADLMRSVGFEMLWDDAGWSAYDGLPEDRYGSVFTSGYEGPDFRQTLRYLDKMNMRWLAWFTQRPSPGVMAGKIGAWGNFEWRSDAVSFPDWTADRDWRTRILRFLNAFPGASFHTCNGGSTYSHTFDIQRYANTNYFSDFGRGPQTNYYFSYIEPPDKWVDIIEPWQSKGTYQPATARQSMTMVPFWGLRASLEDQEYLRRDLDTYRFLRREGVAGRWSYTFHPVVQGDEAFYYTQRTSYDRLKACIILKHQAPGPVTIFPRGLQPDGHYVIEYDLNTESVIRTGTELMAEGIVLPEHLPGELIYLNLPNRPRSGRDHIAPIAPGNVLARRETNLGHIGMALYWSAGTDDTWISAYEVRRGDTLLGKVSIGTCYFDHADGWDLDIQYAVRSLDGDGNASAWTAAIRIDDEPLSACALGGLFREQGRDGWFAETTKDGLIFTPMHWVAPPQTASADEGGSPNQPGGVEGWWEGAGGECLGRAWMQSSHDACCVRTWVAPLHGSIRVVSRVMKEWYRQSTGTPLRARILHNRTQVWPDEGWAVAAPGDLVGAVHDRTLTVAPGDSIRFILDQSDDPEHDIAAWMPRICYRIPTTARTDSIIRLRCGTSRPYTDRFGNIWSADYGFQGGCAVVDTSDVQEADDPALYRRGRQGQNFTYRFPVALGLYAVRLRFTEPKYQWLFSRPFNIEINGHEVLRNFDICQDARGYRKAHDRIFRFIVPDADGQIVLHFTGGFEPDQATDEAIIQAIEILPDNNPVVRINCGSSADFVDWNSMIWERDHTLCAGQALQASHTVKQASPTLYDQALYQTARCGRDVRYAVPLPPGLYTVHLKFAELWQEEPGKRLMDIQINGRTLWSHWDPWAASGEAAMAIDLRILNITPDSAGTINIYIKAVGDYDAIIQGIEIE